MCRNVKSGITNVLSAKTVSGYTLFCSLRQLILCSDNAHFTVRLNLYQGAIWYFSTPETGHFACRNGVYCKVEK